jgi:hypothetical protein
LQLSNNATKPQLPPHEWAAVIFIISIFLILTLNSLINGEKPLEIDESATASEPLIEITLAGALKYPGTYQVEKGTPLIDAINQAEPLPNADLKKIKNTSQITRSRKIVIKEARMKRPKKTKLTEF